MSSRISSRRAAAGVVIALAMGAAGCAGASTDGVSTTGPQAQVSSTTAGERGLPAAVLRFAPCDRQFRCAKLAVPISYSDPAAGTTSIEVVELPASGSSPVGDMVLNPGGPGESGVQYLEEAWSSFPPLIRQRFSLVSFDPRGIGQSSPVQCLTPAGIRSYMALDPAPVTPPEIAEVVAANRSLAEGCQRSLSPLMLANLGTANVARDMDRLRQALGQSKLTYFGYSYGTYLGAEYAELFPHKVRAMVLDGAVDPALGIEQFLYGQGAGFEQDLHDFLGWCATSGQCGPISSSRTGAGADAAFSALFRRFEQGLVLDASLPAAEEGGHTVDLGIFEIGVISGLYSPGSWPSLGQTLAEAEHGNGTDLAELADQYAGESGDGKYSNIVSANLAIFCVDHSAPIPLSAYPSLAASWARTEPDFGAALAWSALPCSIWPAPASGHPAPASAPGLPPVVVVGSTHDPATPYAWAQALASQLPGAVLLTRSGDGHTAYQFSSCVRNLVDRYLLTLGLPPRGTVCPSDGYGLP